MEIQEYEVLYSQINTDQEYEIKYSQFEFNPNITTTNIERTEEATKNSIYLFLLISFLLAGLIAFLLRIMFSQPKIVEVTPINVVKKDSLYLPTQVNLIKGNPISNGKIEEKHDNDLSVYLRKDASITVQKVAKVLTPNKVRIFEGHLPFIYTLSMRTYDDFSDVKRYPNENNTDIGLYRIAHCGSDKRDQSTKRFYIAPPFDYFTESGVRSLKGKTIYAVQDGIKMPAAFGDEGTVTIKSSKVKKGLVKFYWEDSNVLVGKIVYDPDYFFDPKNIFVEKAVIAKETHNTLVNYTYHINLKDQNNEYVTFGTDKTDLKFKTYYTDTGEPVNNTKSFNSLKVMFKTNEIYLEITKNKGKTKLLYEYKKGPTELIGFCSKSTKSSEYVICMMLRYFIDSSYNKPLFLQLHPDICESLSVKGHVWKTAEEKNFKIKESTLSKNGKKIKIKLLDFDVTGLSYFNVMYHSKIILRFVQ